MFELFIKQSKKKSSANATPKKNGTSNGEGSPHSDASPSIPNLRLEAKLIAEVSKFAFVYLIFILRKTKRIRRKTMTLK